MNRIETLRVVGAQRQTSALSCSGFTVIELTVCIATASILIALLLPAVQSAREAGRKTQCRNNLRQIGVAMHSFHGTYNQFPGNGWGWAWIAEPSRGAGRSQPGGWIFQLLPQLEQAAIWQTPSSLIDGVQQARMAAMCAQTIPVFKCPSRPTTQTGLALMTIGYRNMQVVSPVSRTDYAVNEGDQITNTTGGPADLAEGDGDNYRWTDVSMATGVSWLRDAASFADLADGASNTYLAGEKYVSVLGYQQAIDTGYDQSMLVGVDLDISRWTIQSPIRDQELIAVRSFGSAHQQACMMLFCDGAVRAVAYNVSADIHRTLGNRRDGGAVITDY